MPSYYSPHYGVWIYSGTDTGEVNLETLPPKNALVAEYTLENLGYSSTQAAQLIAPLTNENSIIQMNQYFQNNPIKDSIAYAALRNQGYSPSFAYNWVASEEGEPIWQSVLKDIVAPAEEANHSVKDWFIIGVIGAIALTLLILIL